MNKNLFTVLNQAEVKGKTPIGYTVTSYQNVLEALQKDLRNYNIAEKSDGVLGMKRNDYSGVSNMTFDSNGMSQDVQSGIWKMSLTLDGAIPVQYNNNYAIAKFGNNSTNNTNSNPFCNSTELCPLELSQQARDRITRDDFKIGISLDLANLGVGYFKKYYASTQTEFTEEMVRKLFQNHCLRAQIVFPQTNKSLVVAVIGQTPFANSACCYITTPLVGANQWKDAGINLKIKVSGQPQDFIPSGTTYTFPCLGKNYYVSKESMDGMNKTQYKKWLQNSAAKFADVQESLQLVKPQMTECFVKLFIPSEKKGQAQNILPAGINENIYSTYQGVIVDGGESSAMDYTGQIRDILVRICDKWKSVKVSVEKGGFWYSQATRPSAFGRGSGGSYNSANGEIRGLFDNSNGKSTFDCSSLPFIFWYDANIIKDQLKSAPSFSTGNLENAPSILSSYLKPQYKIQKIDITESTEILPGDIMWITADERVGSNSGHAAMAYPHDGKIYTLEIGDPRNRKQRNVEVYYTRSQKGCFYKHLIRIVQVKNEQ